MQLYIYILTYIPRNTKGKKKTPFLAKTEKAPFSKKVAFLKIHDFIILSQRMEMCATLHSMPTYTYVHVNPHGSTGTLVKIHDHMDMHAGTYLFSLSFLPCPTMSYVLTCLNIS